MQEKLSNWIWTMFPNDECDNSETPRDGGLMRKDMKNLFVQSHATNPDLDPS